MKTYRAVALGHKHTCYHLFYASPASKDAIAKEWLESLEAWDSNVNQWRLLRVEEVCELSPHKFLFRNRSTDSLFVLAFVSETWEKATDQMRTFVKQHGHLDVLGKVEDLCE